MKINTKILNIVCCYFRPYIAIFADNHFWLPNILDFYEGKVFAKSSYQQKIVEINVQNIH